MNEKLGYPASSKTNGSINRRAVLAGAVSPFLLAACSGSGSAPRPTPSGSSTVSTAGGVTGGSTSATALSPLSSPENEALTLINQFRAANGRNALGINAAAMRAAETQNDIMIANGTLAHEFGPSTTFQQRLIDAGVVYTRAAENIALGQLTVAEVITAWQNSPGHRANMLLNGVLEIGFAEKIGPSNRRWWTLILVG